MSSLSWLFIFSYLINNNNSFCKQRPEVYLQTHKPLSEKITHRAHSSDDTLFFQSTIYDGFWCSLFKLEASFQSLTLSIHRLVASDSIITS